MPPSPDSSRNRLADLIGSIYDTALDETLWDGISNRIAEFYDSTSTVIKIHSLEGHVSLLDVTQNLVLDESLHDWAGYWHQNDLWVKRLRHFGMNQIFTDDALVRSDGERDNDAFYQEWLRHLDIYHVIGAAFPVEGNAIGILGIHSPEDAARYTDRHCHFFSQMLPHLQRAVNLGARMAHTQLGKEIYAESLDAIDTGVMILDVGGVIRYCNGTAEQMLSHSSELLVRGGRLTAQSPGLRAKLKSELSAALLLANGALQEAKNPIRIDRSGQLPWSIAITPLRPRWPKLIWQRPLALVLMRDPEYPPYAVELLRSLFSLTPMEATVASILAKGTAPEQIAALLEIGLGTVRTHLKQVLAKTGTKRQAEAVALISRSIAARPTPTAKERRRDV